MDKKSYFPIVSGLITSIIFGFSFLFTKEALDLLAPFHLLAFRFSFAAGVLTLLKYLKVIKVDYSGKRIKLLLMLGIFQPVFYFVFETIGLNLTTSSEAGMVIALIPVIVTILGAIFLKEIPTPKQLFFIITSVLGVFFIIFMGDRVRVSGEFIGLLLLLGAVLSAGIFNIISRKLSLEFNAVEITYIMMLMGAITFNTISLIQHTIGGNLAGYLAPIFEIEILIAVVYLGILSSVVAFFLVNFMLSQMEASRSAVFANLTTIVSVIAGVTLRNEPFYWFHAVGCILIIIGVWGTNYYRGKGKLKDKKRFLRINLKKC
ncbi:DMT family transporter [Halonatronum saccharophilum]|uniref:DMT family transporter n=1 Tax=Halonatronum saccharophilum TaxID=150060 RepID=UPI0004876E84|nr:DMT family transporter [Halonatronum saccharophilum]